MNRKRSGQSAALREYLDAPGMTDTAPGHEAGSLDQEDALRFIGEMTGELRDLADRAELLFLAYLLDMACQEAIVQLRPRLAVETAGSPEATRGGRGDG